MFKRIKKNVLPVAKSALTRVGSAAYNAAKTAAMNEIRSAAGTTGVGRYRRKGRGLYSGRTGRGLYTGRGSYTRSPGSNALIKGGRPSFRMSSSNDETQSIMFSHCEFVQDIFGSSTPALFTVQGFNLNPGLQENFPFLAQIAQNFEEYEFIQLIFHFKATVDPSASNNSSGATGTIILVTNYNAGSELFQNKEVMMQYHGANSGRLTDDHHHGIECDPRKNSGTASKYIRALPVLVGQDAKTYDLGIFQLAMVNLPTAFKDAQVGELWVEYTVRLSKPRIFTALSGGSPEYRVTSPHQGISTPLVNGGLLSELFGVNLGNLFRMQQSQIAVLLTQGVNTGAGPTYALPNAGSYILTFPSNYTGLVEITWCIEISNLIQIGFIGLTVSGNIARYADQLAATGGGTAGDIPDFQNYVVGGSMIYYMTRWYIQASTGNINTTIAYNFNSWNVNSTNQTQLIVRQCNPFLGKSNLNNLPNYLDVNNNVATPY